MQARRKDEYLLCLDLLLEAHDDTFAWADNPAEEPHPAGDVLEVPAEENHKQINIHASSKPPAHTQLVWIHRRTSLIHFFTDSTMWFLKQKRWPLQPTN